MNEYTFLQSNITTAQKSLGSWLIIIYMSTKTQNTSISGKDIIIKMNAWDSAISLLYALTGSRSSK